MCLDISFTHDNKMFYMGRDKKGDFVISASENGMISTVRKLGDEELYNLLVERKIIVDTPKGKIQAEPKGVFDEYPGIFVSMDDAYANQKDGLMATVEYDNDNERLQIASYVYGSDQVRTLTDFETGDNFL